jgi:hypothetical protein
MGGLPRESVNSVGGLAEPSRIRVIVRARRLAAPTATASARAQTKTMGFALWVRAKLFQKTM